jgi:DNA-directed RNA polymerase specialized sigma24 family protein
MKNKANQAPFGHLSQDQFTKYKKLARAKSWNLSPQDTDDVFQDLCEAALRSVRRGTHNALDEALNSQVYWHVSDRCKKQRLQAQSLSINEPAIFTELNTSTGDNSQPSSFEEVEDQMVEEDRALNIAQAMSILESNIPSHLMRVAKMQMAGMTRKQIAHNLNKAEGTVQYHIEEFRRRALALFASLGITSMSNLEVANFRTAA